METYFRVVEDLLNSLAQTGFRRVVFVNGHGGNSPAEAFALEWCARHPEVQVRVHHWWRAPKTWAKVREIDPDASHASWMEAFPWTRLSGVSAPEGKKPMVDPAQLALHTPEGVRALLGDGSFGGAYEKPIETMSDLWRVGVEETRAALEGPWR